MPTEDNAPASATQDKPAGQLLYEAWNIGIGCRPTDICPWDVLNSDARSTWECYGADPSTIGTANEPWARAVLNKAKREGGGKGCCGTVTIEGETGPWHAAFYACKSSEGGGS